MTTLDQKMTNAEATRIFNAEFLPLADYLYNLAYTLVKNSADANDLVQDAYAKAWKNLHQYEQGSNAKAWMSTILRNSFINDYRKKMRRPNIQDTPEGTEVDYKFITDDVMDKTLGDEMTVAMERLSPEYRQIIILKDLEDFKYEEIAELLGLKIGTVRSRLFRGRNELKALLMNYGKDLGYQDNRNNDDDLNSIPPSAGIE